jgi:hypothetical protein
MAMAGGTIGGLLGDFLLDRSRPRNCVAALIERLPVALNRLWITTFSGIVSHDRRGSFMLNEG